MFQSKHTTQNPYSLNLFSPWIFCSFLKFLIKVKSPLTILWNCLNERCFKLHSSFNRLETGSTRKNSLSLRFVAVSRKNAFHIKVKSHNAEAKLCHFYQFSEAFSGIESYQIFCPCIMFNHYTINGIWLMLFLHELNTFWYWSNSLL